MLIDRRRRSWVIGLAAFAAMLAARSAPAQVSPPAPQASSLTPQASPGLKPLPSPQDPSADPVGVVVSQVLVEGNETIPLHKVMADIRTRTGRPLDITVLEEDVRRLNRRFVDARPVYQRGPDGGLIVTFKVVERPTLRYIKYVGARNKLFSNMEKTLNKETGLKVGDPRDPYAIESARAKIEEYYHTKGFGKVRCTIFEGDKPKDRGAIFIIHEGPQQKIEHVRFVGQEIVSGGRLYTQIQSKTGFLWLFGGKVDREKIEQDVDRLTAYYRSLGFFRAEIGRELEFDDEWLTLTFYVNEGPRYAIRNISVVGNTKFTTEHLMTDVKIKPGDYFDQGTLTGDQQWIEDTYGEEGYIFAKATPEPRFLDEPGTMDLVFNVEEGDRWRIGRIQVHVLGDDPHTRRETVLNRVSLRPGDIANVRKKRDSERRLLASGLFINTPDKQHQWPKIVLNPNDSDLGRGETDTAKRPSSSDNYRGQSPDNETDNTPARVADLELTPDGAVLRPWVDDSGAIGEGVAIDVADDSAPWATWDAKGAPTRPVAVIRGQSPDRPSVERRGSSTDAAWRGSGTTGRAVSSTSARPLQTPEARQASRDTYSAAAVVRFQDPGYGYNPNGARPIPSLDPAPAPRQFVPAPNTWQGYGNQTPTGAAVAQPWSSYGQQQPVTAPATQPQGVPPQGLPSGGRPYYPTPEGSPSDQPLANGYTNAAPSIVGPQPSTVTAPPAGGGYLDPGQLFPDGGYGYFPGEPARIIDPVVEVHETQTGRFMLGAGYNSQAGVVGSIVLEEQNFDWRRVPTSWEDVRNATAFRGGGQVFRIEAAPGTQVQRYSFSFREPYWFDTPVNFGLSGYLFNRRYVDWFEERLGGNIRLGYQLTPDVSIGSTFGAENVEISNPTIPTPPQLARVLGNNSSFSTGLDLIYDTRDSAFLPTQGFRMAVNGEFVFGSFDYPRVSLDLQKHKTVLQRADGSGRHVVSLSGRFGVSGTQTPIYDAYFAGGYSTIRGFNFRGASPTVLGVPVGGNFQMLGTAQYMFPLVASDMIRGVAFVDFGTVEEDVRFDPDTFRVAPGAGVRVTVPALGPAPIAIDFAFPVHHAPGDDIQNFSLFVGLNF